MKLQNISITTPSLKQPCFQKRKNYRDYFSARPHATPSYTTIPQIIIKRTQDENAFFEEFKTHKGKVTRSEYEDIVKKHPKTLVKSYALCEQQENIKTRPETMAKIAVCLRDYYNQKYKDYTIISIGTSPSPITEVMENIGCQVIYLPITQLRFIEQNPLSPFRRQYPTNASRHPNIKTLMDYATKKGINKKNKGELVVLDYSATGKTLSTMGEILKERGDIDPKRIHLHALNKDLEQICKNTDTYTKYGLDVIDVMDLKEDLYCSEFSKITNVPHFIFNEPQRYSNKKHWELFRDFDNYSQPEARAWALCTTHEAVKMLNRK